MKNTDTENVFKIYEVDESQKVFTVIVGAILFLALMTPMLGFWYSMAAWFIIAGVTILSTAVHFRSTLEKAPK